MRHIMYMVFGMAFVLAAWWAGMNVSCAADMPIGAAPTVSIDVSSPQIKVGESVTISWSSTDVTACSASGAWSGTKGVSGTETVRPTDLGDQTYVLACSGSRGIASAQATVGARSEVSSRITDLAAIDENDFPFGSHIVSGVLPENGVGPKIAITTSADTVKGGSVFLTVKTSVRPTNLYVTLNGVSGKPSYFNIDLTRSDVHMRTNGSDVMQLIEPSSNTTVSITHARQQEISRRRLQPVSPSNPTIFSYDLLLTIGQDVPESNLQVEVVAVYASPSARTSDGVPLANPTPGEISPRVTSLVSLRSSGR